MTRQQIAREWLIFLVCIVIGLFVTYFMSYYHVLNSPYHNQFTKNLNAGDMWNDLFRRGSFNLWATIFAPYLVVSVLRSIIWAAKSARQN
jgi:cytochrome c biogenesis factor